MDSFAVAIMPVTDVDEWATFCREISDGDRAEGHRDFLRRGGVTKEHVFHQRTPAGDLMILVWEGVDQKQQADHLGSVLTNPQSEHERYLRDRVLPVIHGIDPSQTPPPPSEQVAKIET